MTKRYPVSPAPGPLEDYALSFDDLFGARAQRHSFRRYLEGLLLPAERNKTLTALANTEPVVGAQRREAQSLQWFLSESRWDPREVNDRRLERLPGKKRPSHKTPLAGGVVCVFVLLVGIWEFTSIARGAGPEDQRRRSSLRDAGEGEKGERRYLGRRP
jgi:hypothetical protein